MPMKGTMAAQIGANHASLQAQISNIKYKMKGLLRRSINPLRVMAMKSEASTVTATNKMRIMP